MLTDSQVAGVRLYLFSVAAPDDQAYVAEGVVVQERGGIRRQDTMHSNHQWPQLQHLPAMKVAWQVVVDRPPEPAQDSSLAGSGSAAISS